jgi:hypothetical protein
MVISDKGHLLFIDPRAASAVPVIDKLTRKMTGAWKTREHGVNEYRGFHRCTGCDAESDNRDHFVVTVKGARLLTNSLAIHYLAFHRADVPRAELAKVASLAAEELEPSAKLMKPRWYSSRHAGKMNLPG